MDIRKEFEPSLKTRSVENLFVILLRNEKAFESFRSLNSFIRFMEQPSSDAYAVKDACLLALVCRIQASKESEAGFCLLTYLLSPGLQSILRDLILKGNSLMEAWSDLWWAFCQTTMSYPVARRQRKIAANLLFDTRHRVQKILKAEVLLQSRLDSLKYDDPDDVLDEHHPQWDQARSMIEGVDTNGLNATDLAVLLGSRVYGENLKDIAHRLGLTYEAVRKRRQRIERSLRKRWSDL